MANVKISELPSLSVVKSNDVIIVNDSSDNTTKKAPLSALVQTKSVTMTLNSALTSSGATTANASVMMITPNLAFVSMYIPNGLTITNNTENAVTLSYTGALGGASGYLRCIGAPVSTTYAGQFQFNGDNAYSTCYGLASKMTEDGNGLYIAGLFSNGSGVITRSVSIPAGGTLSTGNGLSLSCIIALA